MVIVYTRDHCPYCVAAKNLLQAQHIQYEERYLPISPESVQQLYELTGGMTFPQIVINDQVIGGFDQLRALHEQGQLHALLQ